jgi:putative flippase GtrA
VIETTDFHYRESIETLNAVQSRHKEQDGNHQPGRKRWMGQVLRFGMVGGLNTIVDLLILNMLLLLFPTNSTRMILIFGAIAYSIGAVNSFLLNKYWTFGYRQRTSWREVARFVVTTLLGIGWSSIILWFASNALHPLLINPTIWANVSKVIAIFGTVTINYLGMSLWVFVSKASKEHARFRVPARYEGNNLTSNGGGFCASSDYEQSDLVKHEPARSHSISVVLPAYNEEEIIARTVNLAMEALNAWGMDFEILVVNDGSTDKTGEIVAALVDAHPRVRLITHESNQGYGSSLVSGFAAATKELVFFMDSDGQFDIQDLQEFFPLIDTYDAVIGYRIDRQDSWMRKINAWGWKQLIGWVLGVRVRDVDCAFKLLHTEFLHQHPLETRGAMINAELLYRLQRAGCGYKEVGVIHLPRLHGQATGAKLSVILRAFRELFVSARKWKSEEQRLLAQFSKRELQTRG